MPPRRSRLALFLASAALTLAGCGSGDGFSFVPLEDLGFTIATTGEFCCRAGDEPGPLGQIKVTNDLIPLGTEELEIRISDGAPIAVTTTPAAVDGVITLVPGATLCVEVRATECPDVGVFTRQHTVSVVRDDLTDQVGRFAQAVRFKPAQDPPDDPSDALPEEEVFDSLVAGEALSLLIFGLFGVPPFIDFSGSQTAGTRANPLLIVAGLEGFQVQSAVTGRVADLGGFTLQQSGERLFGALPMHHPDGGNGIFTLGESSGVFYPLTDEGFSNFVQIAFMQGVTDAYYLCGENADRSALIVAHGGFSYFRYDPDTSFATERIQFAPSIGSVFSAAARTRDGDRLLVTSPDNDNAPGRLFRHAGADDSVPVEIGTLGNRPRRIRCLGRLAVVSNFGDGTLTLIRWELDGTVEILGTVDVGDGPVGIDLRRTPEGIAVVSTGLNDDTIHVTVVDPDTLAVVSNRSRAAPAGLTGPGHATWLSDTHIAVSGNTSNNIAVLSVSDLLAQDP